MPDEKDSCVKPAGGPIVKEIKDEKDGSVRKESEMALARVGKEAPDFEASAYVKGEGFRNIKLSDYKGKWMVLCFYPGDFTFVWPTELSAVAVRYQELKDLGVEVLAVSTDSRFTHKIWEEQELAKMTPHGIPFPMLSDSGGRIGSVYGVYEEAAGVDIRGRFLIDPDGMILAMEVLTPEVGRNVNELIRQIQAFQHVRATGEVTPSGWVPGKPTLKPGPDLVGKVWQKWQPEPVQA
jgi:alkyl hydroperoxide reductase subunit AhpC